MDWQQHIHSDSSFLGGKPVIKGTRLPVDFILDLFAAGWSQQSIIENYPMLTEDALRAVFAFAAETMHEEAYYVLRRKVA